VVLCRGGRLVGDLGGFGGEHAGLWFASWATTASDTASELFPMLPFWLTSGRPGMRFGLSSFWVAPIEIKGPPTGLGHAPTDPIGHGRTPMTPMPDAVDDGDMPPARTRPGSQFPPGAGPLPQWARPVRAGAGRSVMVELLGSCYQATEPDHDS
jgi:hypothetical protein